MVPGLENIADASLDRQVAVLEAAVRRNPMAEQVLLRARELDLPNWYLGAGCVAGTVWNLAHGNEATHGIKDYDLVYFDATDLGAEAEQEVERRVDEAMRDLGVPLDVTNEARVHLWYGERFGKEIAPYRSTEEAISTWPATSSSIGVRLDEAGFTVCAPFGLRDLFALQVRPNKVKVSEEIYLAKATRWSDVWPRLEVHTW